jgi:signal transduction histidine kinase
MKYGIILIFLVLLNTLWAITPKQVDSLHNLVTTTKNDSLRVLALNKLAFHYIFNNRTKAVQLIQESEKIALTKNYKQGINEIIYTKGVIHDVAGQKDSAWIYFDKSLKYSQQHKFAVLEVRSLNGLGMNSWNKAKYKDAINYFYKALQLNDKLNKKEQLTPSIFYNNIGLIYQDMKLYEKALNYHQKALEIRKKENLVKDIVASLNNMGICYHNTKREKLAIKTYLEGMELAVSSNNHLDYYKIMNNLADTYNLLKEYEKSVELIETAIKEEQTAFNNPRSSILSYGKLAIAYSKLNKPNEAILVAEKGLEILKNDSSLRSLSDDIYYALTMCYYLKGDLNKADYYQEKYFEEIRQNFSEDNNLAIAEMEVRYETEKKENEILISNQKLRSQRIFTAFSLAFAALLMFILYLIYQNRDKRQQLKIANHESRLAVLLVDAEQKERARIARDLHDGVSQKLAVIQMHLSMNNDAESMKNANTLLQQTITDVRGISHNLFPPDLDKGLLPALNHLCDQNNFINKNTKFKMVLNGFSEHNGLNKNIEHLVFRIVQEIANNTLKYARAEVLQLNLNLTSHFLELNTSDNGIGFDTSIVSTKSGIGLKNIVDRVNQIGGKIEITSNIGFGTSFQIKIPLKTWNKK